MSDASDPRQQGETNGQMAKAEPPDAPVPRALDLAQPTPIVGIGASAGGLDAFKAFFATMPSQSGIGFVLVQHLDPSHKSILTELVGRQTQMPVMEAEDGMPVAADRVHIIPPDSTLTIVKGILHVDRPAPPRQRRFPIDTFFQSLAEDQEANAAAIVLSGIGSDGTLGIRTIKEHGGLTLAQSEHDQLAMTGMPQSAAATGLIDSVMRVEDMPARLLEYQRHLIAAASHGDSYETRQVTAQQIAAIASLLRSGLGHDFANYNENTLARRILRRMQLLRIDNVQHYIRQLRNEPLERNLLFQELLINVTEFFRDPAAFEVLETEMLPTLLAGKTDADQIRVWVPGCATGEEVYSIAILLKEEMDRHAISPRVQIFGTDIDESAVAVARAGRYIEPKGALSAERLARWFEAEVDGYRVVRQIREMCVFSTHSVVRDPPFSKLDLVSCRNLLIYLNPDLQERVIRMFHYALHPGGILFLGPSEGVTRGAHLFEPLDAKHRLFRRRDTAIATHFPDFRSPEGLPPATSPQPAVRLTDRIEKVAHAALEKHSPAYVVVNRQHDVIRFSGGEIGRYLEPSAGPATLGLFAILRRSLRQTVRAALEQVAANRQAVLRHRVRIKMGGATRAINVIVEPITVEGSDPNLNVVAFQDLGTVAESVRVRNAAEPRDAIARELEEELSRTKEQLQTALDTAQSAIDETRSNTEEYQTVNEELQSSNEELETAKEEMQSINEELQTVNSELSSKNDQLMRLNSDMQNLLESTQIATIFLDNQLRIKRFTPAIASIFNLREGDVDRPIADIASRLNYHDLQTDVQTVLQELSVIEREVWIADTGTTFIMRIRPYHTVGGVADGVVITFVDITALRRTEEALKEHPAIVEFAQDALVSISRDGTVRSWNPGAERLFGYPAQYAVRRQIGFLIASDATRQPAALLAAALRGDVTGSVEILHKRPNGVEVPVEMTAMPIRDANAAIVAIAMTARDISERKRAEAHSTLLLNELSHRVKNVLASVQSLAMETLRVAPTLEAFKEVFMARLRALSRTHDLLVDREWRDAGLRDVLEAELAPYQSPGKTNWTATGENLRLTPKMALAIGMAFHELATNAVKFGALSVPSGHIVIAWSEQQGDDGHRLHLTWVERGGPTVTEPAQKGFGSRMIAEGLAYELDGDVQVDYHPEGVRCIINVPIPAAGEPA